MLVPSIHNTVDIVRKTQEPELYITARGLPAHHQLQAAELFT